MTFIDKTASLLPQVLSVIRDKATEYPGTGLYNELPEIAGTYLCRRCGLALFRGENQFHSGCGWPAFDNSIGDAVLQKPDADGRRTEILCSRCNGHLGHVFVGEHFTPENLRHCVNSVALDFVANEQVLDTEEAIVAGGCFWGVEHYLSLLAGVLKVESGYTGGHVTNPGYDQICQGNTGHYEAVRVLYDKHQTDYQSIIRRFFEIHDPEQVNGQGPDLGPQYKSAIFCYNNDQRTQAQSLIELLQQRGYHVATRLLAAQVFWPAESYHQSYYRKNGSLPYCHRPVSRFA